jgi:MFS family permease
LLDDINKDKISKTHVTIFSFIAWFLTGFDLLQIILLVKQTHYFFFPMYDKENEMFVIYAILSLMLFTRLLGGIFFGAYGDNNGRKSVLKITIVGILITICFSGSLPFILNIHNLEKQQINLLIPFIVLVLVKCITGFFIGGLYPTVAVFAFENIHYEKNDNMSEIGQKIKRKEEEKCFEESTRKNTGTSALIQSGFHAGFLVIAFIIWEILSPLSLDPTLTWLSTSIIGFIIGFVLICILLLFEKKRYVIDKPDLKYFKKTSMRSFIIKSKNNALLQNFWFITTGLFYIYYFLVSIMVVVIDHSEIKSPHITSLFLLLFIFIAHLWVGGLCSKLWNKTNSTSKTWDINKKFINFLEWIYNLKILSKIPIIPGNINKAEDEEEQRLGEKNLDLLMVIFTSLLIIPFAIAGLYFYSPYLYFNNLNDGHYWIIVVFSILVILLANSSWSLIPSMLSSRFPVEVRNTATNIAYNGGLIVTFVLPLLAIQFVLKNPQWQSLLFLPLMFGAISMIIGAKRIISSTLTNSVDIEIGNLQKYEVNIKFPSTWIHRKKDGFGELHQKEKLATMWILGIENDINQNPDSLKSINDELQIVELRKVITTWDFEKKGNLNSFRLGVKGLLELKKAVTPSWDFEITGQNMELKRERNRFIMGVHGREKEYITKLIDGLAILKIISFKIEAINFAIICKTNFNYYGTYHALFERMIESMDIEREK